MSAVSIIVPVYNAEEKLNRCLKSLLNQSILDFEILLIDDGSSDGSGAICDAAAETDSRVKVIHQVNAGAAAARNAGIKAAHGEYIAFCDSDDVVSEHWIERLLQFADEGVLPICGYCSGLQELGIKKEYRLAVGKQYDVSAYWKFQRCGLAGYLWNALYSRKTIIENGLYIPERRELNDINEDLTFALRYVPYINGIVYTGHADYFYDTHEGSLSRKGKQFYFTKYSEKYRLWKHFLIEQHCFNSITRQEMCETYLYHFLTALSDKAETVKFRDFKEIALSEELQECLNSYNSEKENRKVIHLLKEKRIALLWCYMTVSKIKGGFRK